MIRRIEAKHPRAIRWFHWVNFPLLAIMIWSGALMLRDLGLADEATRVEQAMAQVLADGVVRTADLGGSASTEEVADAVISALRAPAAASSSDLVGDNR